MAEPVAWGRLYLSGVVSPGNMTNIDRGKIEHGTENSPDVVTGVDDSDNSWVVEDADGNIIARFKQDESVTDVTSINVGSADVSGRLGVGDVDMTSNTQDVSDDSVVTVDVTSDAMILVTASRDDALGWYLTGFDSITNALTGSAATNQNNTDLTGTTGPDGSLNVSRVDNTLHVENRLGSQHTVDVMPFTR